MEDNKIINCDVATCVHHNEKCMMCNLTAINISSSSMFDAKKPEESMCLSYKGLE